MLDYNESATIPPIILSAREIKFLCNLRSRTLQRQDASVDDRYHDNYDNSWPPPPTDTRDTRDTRGPLMNGYISGGQVPASGYNRYNNGQMRRRLPDENAAAVKKKPWSSFLTGWSSDDLSLNRVKPVLPGSVHYNNTGISNGYPGNSSNYLHYHNPNQEHFICRL